MKILQVNSTDGRGGAARVSRSLHHAYRMQGHDSRQIVGHKLGNDPHTIPIRHDLSASWLQRPFWRAEDSVAKKRFRGARWLRNLLRFAADPQHMRDWYQGREPFQFPGTKNILKLSSPVPDILHLHNLHGHYFDLRQLPFLSNQVPTLLSLHDAWLLSGHCSFSFECERWKSGCGSCPDLTIPPAVRLDATAENWQRKKKIYLQSHYHIITPSKWLADRVENSILMAGLTSLRIIPHGINLNIFHPGSQIETRQDLGLASHTPIIIMVANGFRDNPWKNIGQAYSTFRRISEIRKDKKILVLAVGDNLPSKHIGNIEVRYLPYIQNEETLAEYYRAADIFLSTSRVEVWGLAISESLACGTPVIAPHIGGIPEQINTWPHEQANGILTKPGDETSMTNAILQLIDDPILIDKLGQNAAQYARSNLNFDSQVENTLDYYRQILNDWKPYHE